MKGVIIIACIILILLMALIVAIQIATAQRKTIKQLKAELQKEQKIAKQKEKIHTGDNNADFNNSIKLLQNYSNKRKRSSKSNS